MTITDDVYSTRETFKDLLANEETKAVIDEYLPGVEDHPMFGMLKGFVVEDLAQIAPDQFNEKMLYALNKELTKVKK
ncbi:hypothetical protein [Aquibacillus sediminis]|uniref:hypothetical protein n=1 Tax=Aquibacillus sediminis TaxID=2574734 RepID=UPI001FE35BF8|nr:hypothetical protein [Aquibacillus sediminis]